MILITPTIMPDIPLDDDGTDPPEDSCVGEVYDCAGVCNGDAVEDCAGTCNGDAVEDCAGTCNGDAVEDCVGVCNGDADCEGGSVCGDGVCDECEVDVQEGAPHSTFCPQDCGTRDIPTCGDGICDEYMENSHDCGFGCFPPNTGCGINPYSCPDDCPDDPGDRGCNLDVDCDDGAFCNGVETCDGSVCQAGTPVDANDGVPCTIDTCDEVNDVIINSPNNGKCSNGAYCDGVETCDAILDCQDGNKIDCDDGLECSLNNCDEGDDLWDDIGSCIIDISFCECSENSDCDDNNQCTDDSCVGGECESANNNANSCSDDLWCTENERCSEGICVGDNKDGDDDGIFCTVNLCDEHNNEITHNPDDDLCGDDIECTVDTCTNTGCNYVPNNLLCEGYGCKVGVCSSSEGCGYEVDDSCVRPESRIYNNNPWDLEGDVVVIIEKQFPDGWSEQSFTNSHHFRNLEITIPANSWVSLATGKDKSGNQLFDGWNSFDISIEHDDGIHRVRATFIFENRDGEDIEIGAEWRVNVDDSLSLSPPRELNFLEKIILWFVGLFLEKDAPLYSPSEKDNVEISIATKMDDYDSEDNTIYLTSVTMPEKPGDDILPGIPPLPGDSLPETEWRIIHVTNLNADGPGSLTAALQESGKRKIVFDVGGTIDLRSTSPTRPKYSIPILNGDVFIDGLSAPKPGITIYGADLLIKASNVIVKHLKIRAGSDMPGRNYIARDSLSIYADNKPVENILIESNSITWGVDETTDVSDLNLNDNNRIRNVIFRNNIIGEALTVAEGSKSSLTAPYTSEIIYEKNLFVNAYKRNPRFANSANGLVINNLMSNIKRRGINIGGSLKVPAKIAAIGNVMIPGPIIRNDARFLVIEPNAARGTEVYMDDNYFIGRGYDWNSGVTDKGNLEPKVNDYPMQWMKDYVSGIDILHSSKVEDYIIENVGARPNNRDPIDTRIINQVKNRNGKYYERPPRSEINWILG
jgi:hypothetical protein